MSGASRSPRLPGADDSPAGEATNLGQVAGRPRPSYCKTCGHIDVLHGLSATGRRTACSVSSGNNATPCGCSRFIPRT